MPRRFQRSVPDELREPHEANVPGLWNVYIVGIGIAILLAFVGGTLWIAWRLLMARFGG